MLMQQNISEIQRELWKTTARSLDYTDFPDFPIYFASV